MAHDSKKSIYAAFAGNLLIAITKFVAAFFTGSSAMISEGIHSMVDTGNQILLLYGLHRAKRPANEQYPFGFGKEVYFWSFVVAILIFALGAGLSAYEGILHLLNPVQGVDAHWNYIVLGLAIVFEGGSLFVAVREFRHFKGKRSYLRAVQVGKDPSAFVVLLEDSAAILGLLVALAGIALAEITGNPLYDGAASVVIGLILGATAVLLAYETKGLLIGEAASPRVVEGIRELAAALPQIDHIGEVLTLHMGPNFILVTISADFKDHVPAGEIEQAICQLDASIKQTYPHVKRVYVEAEKCMAHL